MKRPILCLLLCGSVAAADSARVGTGKHPSVAAPELGTAVTTVHYSEEEVVRVKTKLRYMTLIVLPKEEQILDFTCGDKDWWVISGTQNFAYIKPAKAGAQTNLNLVTASGNVYSFLLSEVSEQTGLTPDLKVFVEPKEAVMRQAALSSPRFYSEDQIKEYLRQIEALKGELQQAKDKTRSAVDSGVSRFISNVRFPYRFEAGKKPFMVRAMYNDEKFTYIQARPEEPPVLYEIKDGKPNLVNFQYRAGVYVVEKILDRGYLAIGKRKLGFTRMD